MKFEDIKPTNPSKHPSKTKRKYYNPDTGKHISYAAAQGIKRRGGPNLLHNPVETPDTESTEMLKERLRCINLISEVLTSIINE